jgi:hypothetical protein
MHRNSDGSGSGGVVLRNHKGEAIAYMACTLENLLNAATGEALALLKGLEFMEQLVLLYVLSLIPSS